MESSENETQFKKCRAAKLRFFFVKSMEEWKRGKMYQKCLPLIDKKLGSPF
jgi:hypothetical protein